MGDTEFADYLENKVSPEVRTELELHLSQCRVRVESYSTWHDVGDTLNRPSCWLGVARFMSVRDVASIMSHLLTLVPLQTAELNLLGAGLEEIGVVICILGCDQNDVYIRPAI